MATEFPDVEVLEVFVVDDTGHLTTPEPLDLSVDARGMGEAIARQLRDVKATPGPRIGRCPAPTVRRGSGEDISQPVLAPAARVLDHLFDDPSVLHGLPALEVETGGERADRYSATWAARLQTGPSSRRREAVLAVHASPSLNLTILELVPRRPRRLHTKTFVRLGVSAVAELAGRLRDETRPTP